MIYFIYPDVDIWEYMVEGIDEKDVICRPLNPNCNKLQIAIRKLFNNKKLPGFMLLGSKMRKELGELKAGDTILIPDYIDVCLFKTIASIVRPKVKKCLWIWNPVKAHERKKMSCVYNTIKETGFEISTFDKGDSKRYNQKHYNQFFRMKQDLSGIEEEYDFYFVGFEKNRGKIIADIQDKLKVYKTKFKIIHNVSECIPYAQNIENIKKARCVIEVVQEGQEGITLRPLEAIAYGKKLLTTNKNIKKYDFYSSQNIFIVGEDDYNQIETFLRSEVVPLPETIVSKYSLTTWLNHYRVRLC